MLPIRTVLSPELYLMQSTLYAIRRVMICRSLPVTVSHHIITSSHHHIITSSHHSRSQNTTTTQHAIRSDEREAEEMELVEWSGVEWSGVEWSGV